MPRFIVNLHRHTVRIRSATIKVKVPSEDAIRELDWTHDSFNDIVEWEEVDTPGNTDEADIEVEIDPDPAEVPDVDLTPDQEFPVDDLQAVLDYLEDPKLHMFMENEIIGGETIVHYVEKLKAWLESQK